MVVMRVQVMGAGSESKYHSTMNFTSDPQLKKILVEPNYKDQAIIVRAKGLFPSSSIRASAF